MTGITGLEAAVTARNAREAEAAWCAWRRQVVLDQLSWAEVQLLPLLERSRLESWLGDDPASGRLLGIVRRAWTEAQVHLHQIRSIVAVLADGGAGTAIIAGPAAVHLRNLRPGSVRPIPELHLLVPRDRVIACLAPLERAGWTPGGPPPPARALSWTDHMPWHRNGMVLRLLWRHVPVVPWRARQCEADVPASRDGVLPVEHLMLARLAHRGGMYGQVPWRVDASLLALTPAQWERCRQLAERYAPAALARIETLHRSGLTPPLKSRSRFRLARHELAAHQTLLRLRSRYLRTIGRPPR